MFANKYAINQINYRNIEEIRMELFPMEMLESPKSRETKRH